MLIVCCVLQKCVSVTETVIAPMCALLKLKVLAPALVVDPVVLLITLNVYPGDPPAAVNTPDPAELPLQLNETSGPVSVNCVG